MANNPLAEVYGFPITNTTVSARNYRNGRLCPFNNRFPNCTKDKADNPLGVCSICYGEEAVITCPVRFREDWIILRQAAEFVWPEGSMWTALPEVKLSDADGESAGNIDYVLVRYDQKGQITDFASIEVQGVYISGNLRNPFEAYINKPSSRFVWDGSYTPRPDYLSSSRKRLIPQMLSKGGIFKTWNKKQCVVLQRSFFNTLPDLPSTTYDKADIAWMLYDLVFDKVEQKYHLQLTEIVYTEFDAALHAVTTTKAGDMNDFIVLLQGKLDEKITNRPETRSPFELL